MKKICFNENWKFTNIRTKESREVNVPYDGMLGEVRSEEAKTGKNGCFFFGSDYEYEKKFSGEEFSGKKTILEFEGVYKDGEVYLNGELVKTHNYGYTGFYVDITNKINSEKENIIKVLAKNSDQPNCRWYSGAGIFRPVYLWVGEEKHIETNGIKVRTLSIKPAKIEISVKTSGKGVVTLECLDNRGEKVFIEQVDTQGILTIEKEIENALLWSDKEPNLYTLNVEFEGDRDVTTFGIRTVTVDAKNGLLINGKREILRGACIHHDNGMLGSVAHPFAEERKIRILKENGYNGIRSAHNPCSKALLDACDRLGMYVLDEMYDGWYIHKNKYDYANHFEDNYKDDLKDLVTKDYNHPSVIMYSLGNEVSETAQKKGIALTEEMTKYLHSLDNRPVTCGVNIFFNFLSSMGFGVYSDKKSEQEEKNAGKKKRKSVGSEFFNDLAGIIGAEFMKTGATLHGSDMKTKEAFSKLDIAGYNYGIKRYKKDFKKYPNRVILGSETFCKDAGKFWNMAKDNPQLIGDFDWAGMDYLGEVGVGAWVYEEYCHNFDLGVGWMTAGSGRIDLTGKPLAEAEYKKVVFDIKDIAMGVTPVGFKKHSPSAWKMTDAISSWSWRGKEGEKTNVEVYTKGDKIELYLNDKLISTKKGNNNYRVIFKNVIYQNGTLKAISYKNDKVVGKTTLTTANEETKLSLLPENKSVGIKDLAYVRLAFTDNNGEIKPLERGIINVKVENGELLALGHACSYNPDGYLLNSTDTYYGEALAIVKPNGDGNIVISCESQLGNNSITVEVK